MVICFQNYCNHRSEWHSCIFFLFPKDEPSRHEWVVNCMRADFKEPSNSSRICSCHFVDGRSENKPTLLLFGPKTSEKRKRNAMKLAASSYTSSDASTCSAGTSGNKNFYYYPKKPIGKAKKKQKIEPSQIKLEDTYAGILDLIKNSTLVPVEPDQSISEINTAAEAASLHAAISEEINPLDFLHCKTECKDEDVDEICLSSQSSHKSDSSSDVVSLNSDSEEELALTKGKSRATTILFKSFLNDSSVLLYYTGLSQPEHLSSLYKIFGSYTGLETDDIKPEDQLLLTLMKLRCNFDDFDLGFRFRTSAITVVKVFKNWLMKLHEVIFKNMTSKISKRSAENKTAVSSLNERWFVMSVIVYNQSEDGSVHFNISPKQYEDRIAFKAVVVTDDNGALMFASSLYPQFKPYSDIFVASKIIYLLKQDDVINLGEGNSYTVGGLTSARDTTGVPVVSEQDFSLSKLCSISEEAVSSSISSAHGNSSVQESEQPQVIDCFDEDDHPPSKEKVSQQILSNHSLKIIKKPTDECGEVCEIVKRLEAFAILSCIPYNLQRYRSEIFQVCCSLLNFSDPIYTHCRSVLDSLKV